MMLLSKDSVSDTVYGIWHSALNAVKKRTPEAQIRRASNGKSTLATRSFQTSFTCQAAHHPLYENCHDEVSRQSVGLG